MICERSRVQACLLECMYCFNSNVQNIYITYLSKPFQSLVLEASIVAIFH